MRAPILLVAVTLFGLAAKALATEPQTKTGGPDWLGGLQDRVAADLRVGKPLVVQVHVALCDNHVIVCGGHGLGDGDNLDKNLYWATTGGFRGWFERRGSGWKLVKRAVLDDKVLVEEVWTRKITPGPAWRSRGVKAPFDVYVVADAWRGSAIDDGVEKYVGDLFGSDARVVSLDGGIKLEAGGAAQIVAWIGHDRWMDYANYPWTQWTNQSKPDAPIKGTMAMACMTYQWLGGNVSSERRVPLLLTSDLLFAGSHAVEGAVRAFADGGSLKDIRDAAAQSYAEGNNRPRKVIDYAFINPGDRRWGKQLH